MEYVNVLERAINDRNPQIVMCVMPNNRADRYNAIKKKCTIDKTGLKNVFLLKCTITFTDFSMPSINLVRYLCLVPCQCILYKTITHRGVTSIATKVAIQMNCKVGGAPWAVEIPLKVRIINIFCVK